MTKCYKIVKAVNKVPTYAVFIKRAKLWEQVSSWYYRRDNAVKFLMKVTRPHQNARYYIKTDSEEQLLYAEVDTEE